MNLSKIMFWLIMAEHSSVNPNCRKKEWLWNVCWWKSRAITLVLNCIIKAFWAKIEVGAPWNRFKPSSKIFLLTFPRRCFFCISVLFLLCFQARLFIDALWPPAGRRLASWLSFVMSNCEVVTFPLVSWVRCGAWVYRFLIFALFLTFIQNLLLPSCCVSSSC